ncbi:MAG: hypothetical protein M0014_07930 [Actinomycetota bacterium]|nr:hypothetical protein [Actinomycetota bacterium]
MEGNDLSAEGLDALPAGGLRQGAGLEGEEVSLNGFFGLGQLDLDNFQFVLVLAAFGSGTSEAGGERGVEEVVAGDGAQQRAADFAFELVGGEPFGWTGGGAVAVAGEAGVVAVAVLVAVRGGADVALAAVSAGDEPGKQVVAGI